MARKQTYGLNNDREGYEYAGVGRNARIESREDRRKKNKDLPVGATVLAGGIGGAGIGGLIGATRDKSKDPSVESDRIKAKERLDVKKKNYMRHLKKGGPGKRTKVPGVKIFADKQSKRLTKSAAKVQKAREAYDAAKKLSPVSKRPLVSSIGKGAAWGAGAGLLASMLMEEQSDNEYALEEVFELGIKDFKSKRDVLAYVVRKTKKPYRKGFRNPARKAKRKIREAKADLHLRRRRKLNKPKQPFDTNKYPPGQPIGTPKSQQPPPKKTNWKKVGIGAGAGVLAGGAGYAAYNAYNKES